MQVAVVGYGIEGRASAAYWYEKGAEVTICDQNDQLEIPSEYARKLGDGYVSNLNGYDTIVRSAGIHPSVILDKNPGIENKITTSVNEFLRVCPSRNIIGITGTKGKGTTSTLVSRILAEAGKTVHLGGNIGIAPLELLSKIKADDWVVLELSSFQLEDFKGPSPHIAVCLMIIEDHINWHGDFERYRQAKQNLFRYQTASDLAVYYAANSFSEEIAEASAGKPLPYMQAPNARVEGERIIVADSMICTTDELKLLGKHNWQNVCAAITAAWQVTQDAASIRKAVISFSGLEHRLEFVREVSDVSYYNDSFASATGASSAALEAIHSPKVLIAGGYDRGVDLHDMAKNIHEFAGSIRKVLLIGASAQRLAAALRETGYDNYEISDAKTMGGIVAQASAIACSGDAVVLSPGFPSYDMFKNFEDRGLQFKSCVRAL